ncbi:MAG TPA: hypothetical protein VLV78_00235 [Thermoanaerobaculia bacterium]|nr:hypothetical protein [Thermoanaerobaculia bacterium]
MRQHGPRRKRLHRRQRGSALLVTLMVMVGLSLLGLGFVAISETESTISVNERNYAQTLSVAEAGARMVVEWFQDPAWAEARGLLPANTNAIKTLRVMTAGPLAGYSGRYKSDTSTAAPVGRLFDKPFKPKAQDRFYGDENHPDVIIDSTTAAAFLTTFNTNLLQDTTNGQVTEIRLYAPPILSGSLNAGGFWESGTRYGLCTIRVTAKKFTGNTAVSERTVKIVISEWPFPGPQGPVQSNANISTGGNFGVHWGKMTSDKQMEIKRPLVGLPWNDPWDRIHYEHGYYAGCATQANCAASSFAATAGPGFDSYGNPNTGGDWCDGYDWLYKLEDVQFEDPWYEARAKTQITNAIVAGIPDPQPYKFNDINADVTANGPGTFTGFSNWFQNQNIDDSPTTCGARDHKLVIFPKIDYNFWKNLSQSASSTVSGVHYLRWVSGEDYTDGITTKKFAQWVNTARAAAPAKSGFYFFDTRNGLDPQGAAPPGVLADPVTVNSSDDGPTFKMEGFFYLNVSVFGTTGVGGPVSYDNFPGEPFRDIGYRKVCDAASNCLLPLGAGPWAYDSGPAAGANDGEFSYQDLNGNGVCDIFLAQRTVTFPTTVPGPRTITEWFPVPWYPGCTPGFNGAVPAANGCSEPHEPFLNLVYPSGGGVPEIAQSCCSGGGAPSLLTPKWEDPAAPTKEAKTKDASGNPVACNAALLIAPTLCTPSSGLACTNIPDPICTSNAYDRDGPLQESFGSPSSRPIMDGVLYNEGDYDTQGNAGYFGSILINGNIIGTGSPEVWFDEFLIKGGWQDKFKDLPRVYITSHETDQ